MFAKLFDTSYGQVVVMRQDNDSGEPEIRFYCEPEGLGTCSMAFGYEDGQHEERDEGFEKVDLAMAEAAAKELNVYSGI